MKKIKKFMRKYKKPQYIETNKQINNFITCFIMSIFSLVACCYVFFVTDEYRFKMASLFTAGAFIGLSIVFLILFFVKRKEEEGKLTPSNNKENKVTKLVTDTKEELKSK